MTNEIGMYLQIQADIAQACKRALAQHYRASGRSRITDRVFLLGVLLPAVVAVLIAPFGLVGVEEWVFQVSWGLLGFAYLMLFLYTLLGIWLYVVEDHIRIVMQVDALHLPYLAALSSDTLKLGRLQVQSECSRLERRTHLVTGALEKVGILPGALAVVAGWSSLVKAFGETGLSGAWLNGLFTLAVINIVFYGLCGHTRMTLARHERMVALTGLALERRQERQAQAGEQ